MSKPSILIVDDELEVCLLLGNYLVRKDNVVSYSNTLKDGLSKFAETKPDVLILDHNMPDGYGIDAIPAFRSMNKALKIIVISAMSNLKEEALNKGADYFLEKPIKLSTLNSIISSN
ncbi:MAG: response regulator [Bacteroidia bacterium]